MPLHSQPNVSTNEKKEKERSGTVGGLM